MSDHRTIGEVFRVERRKRGLTILDVTGQTGGTLSRWEHNRGIGSVHTFVSLCRKLEIDPVRAFEAVEHTPPD